MPFPVFAALGAAASVFGAVSSYNASKDAASQQRALGQANAKNILAETEELYRRKAYEFGQIRGTARARIAASGLSGRTRVDYLAEMKRLQDKELSWIRESGSSRAAIARAGGQTAAQQSGMAGQSALFGGISNTASTFGPSFSNWWASRS